MKNGVLHLSGALCLTQSFSLYLAWTAKRLTYGSKRPRQADFAKCGCPPLILKINCARFCFKATCWMFEFSLLEFLNVIFSDSGGFCWAQKDALRLTWSQCRKTGAPRIHPNTFHGSFFCQTKAGSASRPILWQTMPRSWPLLCFLTHCGSSLRSGRA